MDIITDIFTNINNNKWNNVLNIIKKNNKKDFNIPYNSIYLLELILINNKIEILKELLNSDNIFLNIFDTDNNPIIFLPIKYNYYNII